MSGPGWQAAQLDHDLFDNGEQPGQSQDGRWRLLLDGEILNLDELCLVHGIASLRAATDIFKCAELFARVGEDIVANFNGAFVIVAWDSIKYRLLLIGDHFASRPLFYRRTDNGVDFASELKGLLAAHPAGTAVDATAICEQLVYGTHFAGRTWLAGCQRIEPGRIVELTASGVGHRTYWQYQYHYSGRRQPISSYASVFAVLLDRAVERCMRGNRRIGMFLSGGYDSRSVAAAIRPFRRPIPAFTFGELNSRDMQVAPVLAARLGLTHIPVAPRKPYLLSHAHAIVWRTEGMLPLSSTTSVQIHDLLCEHMDIFLTGFLGEYSGSHTWPALLLARGRAGAVKAIYHRFVAPRLARARAVLRPEVFDRARDELLQRFYVSFDRIDNAHPMDISDAWNFNNLQTGSTFQAPVADRHRLEMRAPHRDMELVDFLMTIPPWSRIEQRVYKRMIADAYPGIRDVPCVNSMRPIEPRFLVEYPRMVMDYVGRRVAAPLRRLAGREDRLGREINDLDADVRNEPALQDQLLMPLLADGCLDDSIFANKEVVTLANDHFAGRSDHGWLLMQLISHGLAVKLLVRNETERLPPGYRI